MKKALVFVLGELSRSPRMQYHCVSLANDGYQVTVIANGSDDKCYQDLESNLNIEKRFMSSVPKFEKILPKLLVHIVKPIWQSILVLMHLVVILRSDVTIVQNPPSIPTLPLFCVLNYLSGGKLIIDWHNYGFTILNLTLKSRSHPLVRLSKFVELNFGRMADAGFCVSEAMKKDLLENFKIKYPITVLYDLPGKHFLPFNVTDKHDFYCKIQDELRQFKSIDGCDRSTSSIETTNETRFTLCKDKTQYKQDRPAIIMSSTSWTEDEDFGILFDALVKYDDYKSNLESIERISSDGEESLKYELPKILCVVTGKGPLKSHFMLKIQGHLFNHVEIILPWLSSSDYPKMIASCDLGVCLHNSSSGVDLPMKVVDMFGCGIPVLAYKYKAINELVVEGSMGKTFEDADGLARLLIHVLKGFPPKKSDGSLLSQYSKNISSRITSRWEANWKLEAKPVFDALVQSSPRIAS